MVQEMGGDHYSGGAGELSILNANFRCGPRFGWFLSLEEVRFCVHNQPIMSVCMINFTISCP